jgi:hypothetical protein
LWFCKGAAWRKTGDSEEPIAGDEIIRGSTSGEEIKRVFAELRDRLVTLASSPETCSVLWAAVETSMKSLTNKCL